MQTIKIRNEEEEKWSGYLHIGKFRQKGDRHIRRPVKMNSVNIVIKKRQTSIS